MLTRDDGAHQRAAEPDSAGVGCAVVLGFLVVCALVVLALYLGTRPPAGGAP